MKFNLFYPFCFFCCLIFFNHQVFAQHTVKKNYNIWYNQPAPEIPIINKDSMNRAALVQATPFDSAWENWSLPIGNGYLGACIFGRTGTERVQLTENSMAGRSLYGGVGLTSFAELFIDFGHNSPMNYKRKLQLDDAVSTVQYTQDDVQYHRSCFASYPDKVIVVRLTSNKKGKLSFTLRPEIPYKKEFGAVSKNNGRAGKVFAEKDLITLSGKMEYLNLLFEGQFKVIPSGGSLKVYNDANGDNGRITVSDADSATIIISGGTSYKLQSSVFTENDHEKKLAGNLPPHERVSDIISNAVEKGYDRLLTEHKKDYTHLFSRVNLDLGSKESPLPTNLLLKNYKAGIIDHYLDELYFQYGRYLLICSSRPGTLPPNLQGVWSQYDVSPWTGGYWHNINIQMNYWPVFTTNLAELFQSFSDYNQAYRQAATGFATTYIKQNNPKSLDPKITGNGWTIGTGASAYNISAPGNHSGPGTGGLTTKMFWDYYEFTGNRDILKKVTYPAILGMSNFLSRVVVDTAGLLLASPSYSPEQQFKGKAYYKTTGCAFDQQMIYENHSDVLKAAKILGDQDPLLPLLQLQLPKLDPVQVGWSGQIKEFREEKFYGEIGEATHRHVSQLVGLYPGTLINALTPAWLDAAKETLSRRGDKSTGWAMAHRLNLWARAKDGDRAYTVFQTLLKTGTFDNLWNRNPPFTIEGNLGGTAGIAEMLLQSHEGYIEMLPALPEQWRSGSYSGLMAKGNFEVAVMWDDGQAKKFTVKSKIGGLCRLKYAGIQQAMIQKISGGNLTSIVKEKDIIAFKTVPGDIFVISSIPKQEKVADPSGLVVNQDKAENMVLQWNKSLGAEAYNVYVHFGDEPGYTLINSKVKETTVSYSIPEKDKLKHCLFKVTALGKSGRESNGIRVNLVPKAN